MSGFEPYEYEGYDDPDPIGTEVSQRVSEALAQRDATDEIAAVFVQEAERLPENLRQEAYDRAWWEVGKAVEAGREIDEQFIRGIIPGQIEPARRIVGGPASGRGEHTDLPPDLAWRLERAARSGQRDPLSETAADIIRDARRRGGR